MRFLLTDHQLAAVTLAAAGAAPSELVAEAITQAEQNPPRPPCAPGQPPSRAARRRASTRRADTLLDTTIPAATGRAVELATGQVLRIEQLADGQCVDLTAFELRQPHRAFSAARTRAEHGIHPTVGATLYSTPPEVPLLTIVADSAPGHDLAFPACTAFEYEPLTGMPGHANCHDIHAALAPVATADPLNLWLPSAVTATGALRSWPANCRRGDAVELRAQADVTVVLSACPDDLYGSSQYEPKPVRLIVRAGGGPSGRPRISRARRTPTTAMARHPLDVELPARARSRLASPARAGWLGFTPAEVARALLCDLIAERRPGAARSPHMASSDRSASRPEATGRPRAG
jgi:uncharacterized protein YcgI (DUF1989 family)